MKTKTHVKAAGPRKSDGNSNASGQVFLTFTFGTVSTTK
jgi:hypothetical protein